MERKLKMSIFMNVLIFVLSLISTIFMLVGFKFMGDEIVFAATKIEAFKFYTVDSNILMGLVALFFACLELKKILGKIDEIPTYAYVLKLVGTVGVTLTFLTTVLYLGPIISTGFFSLFKNSNLFYHLVIPILSIITFVLFENTDKLKLKHTFIGIVTMVIYSIFYTLSVVLHIENGKVIQGYDWYGFVRNGLSSVYIVTPLMLLFTYLISFGLYFFNKKLNNAKSDK